MNGPNNPSTRGHTSGGADNVWTTPCFEALSIPVHTTNQEKLSLNVSGAPGRGMRNIGEKS
jgi:hypothetical protein